MFIPELSFDEKAKLGKLITQSVNNSAYTHDVYDYIEELLQETYQKGVEDGVEDGKNDAVCEEEHCDVDYCWYLEDEYQRGFNEGEREAEKNKHNA